jgi:hypothetical protein
MLFLASAMMLRGQAPFPNKDEIKQFMASKTCIVLEQDQFSFYNADIKKAVETYWNITPYEFIDTDEFATRRRNPAYSFIVLTQTDYENDKSGTRYNFLNLLQGKNVSKLGEMPEVCAIPLSLAGNDDDDYSYKLGAILFFMQKHAQKIADDPSITGRRYLRYYNANTPQVKQKKIIVRQNDLAAVISSIDKIKAIYPYEIEIVEEEAIVKAIEQKTPNTLILHSVGPAEGKSAGWRFNMLIGTDDSDMYYYQQYRITRADINGLLPDDLKRMAR